MIKKSYYLNFQKRQISNAKVALLPSDPFRVSGIAGKSGSDLVVL